MEKAYGKISEARMRMAKAVELGSVSPGVHHSVNVADGYLREAQELLGTSTDRKHVKQMVALLLELEADELDDCKQRDLIVSTLRDVLGDDPSIAREIQNDASVDPDMAVAAGRLER